MPVQVEWIAVSHDGVEGVARVARSSFEGSLKKNGWKEVTADSDTELQLAAAEALGLDVDHFATDEGTGVNEAELAAAISAATTPTNPEEV